MRRELAIEFSRVTEAAALASYRYIGRGKNELADDAAVKAMLFNISKPMYPYPKFS